MPFQYDVFEFGALGDGKTNDAKAIDSAIEACAKAGGGTVYFPPGRFISGTIHLKSNIIIDISPGATIATSLDDDVIDELEELPYNPEADLETTYFNPSLFQLQNIENVYIKGGGTIDGNRKARIGPKPVAVKQCKRVTIRDVKIVNAPNYALSFIDSEDLTVDNVWIDNAFADGIDFDGCRYAQVSNCRVSSIDDAMCLKSSPAMGKPINCEHILIINSAFLTEYTAFKIGSETGPGDFLDIVMDNCTLGRCSGLTNHPGGITISSLDGAHVAGFAISNISMHHIGTPINIEIGNRGRAQKVPVPGIVEDITINNIVSLDAVSGCSIRGISDSHARNISINNINIHLTKDATTGMKASYAKWNNSNEFPRRACAFKCENAEDIRVRNYHVIFSDEGEDVEPIACLDNVIHCSILDSDV